MMIAIAEKPLQDPRTQANDRFLEMLPKIRRRALFAFRSAPSEHRAELVQESIANAYIAFVRLVDRGREDTAFATPLADYAIRRVLAARLVGSGLNSGDVLSRAARLGSGIIVESLDTYDEAHDDWRGALVEDRRAGPAETAATRIDVAAWLSLLSRRDRQIAKTLATGESTCEVARQFNLSSGRVSQLRGELEASWRDFQGEEA